jgi:two-component system NtrC family sensor kinase
MKPNNQKVWGSNSEQEYRKLFRISVSIMILVSIAPLVVLTAVNYYQYRKTYEIDVINPLTRQINNLRNNLESFVQERISVLKYIANFYSAEDLKSPVLLNKLFSSLRNSFGGFVDLGVIDSSGLQINYIGVYNLLGKNYKMQDWFNKTIFEGVNVNDVFFGYRGVPHFSISVYKPLENGDFLIVRASINSDVLTGKIIEAEIPKETDIFLVNRNGYLQTNSKFNGKILEKCPFELPEVSKKTEISQTYDKKGKELYLIHTSITDTPFILVEVSPAESLWSNWLKNRNQLLVFMFISVVLIVIAAFWGSNRFVRAIKERDLQAAQMMHEIEYTNKMASIGRLAAGVSHEINNPLSIINENAGLVSDILQKMDYFPEKERIQKCISSILRNVERCSKITHQLLGFAKRMEPNVELINLNEFVNEIVGFVSKEAKLKNVSIEIENYGNESLQINSDRGLLQQVFINILNNSIEAVSEGGRIFISFKPSGDDKVEINIIDNGKGISEKDLPHIFEPFFTTKKGYGTGLGLSITYGIVKKLGGEIFVESKVNEGTKFTLIFPQNYNPFYGTGT